MTPFGEGEAQFSPEGRFVAYRSDESGQDEVYVLNFPEGGGKWQVSEYGGGQPRWSDDGKELFYVEENTLIAVEVSTAPGFSTGRATRLFEDPSFAGPRPDYDVSADGQRFVMIETLEAEPGKKPSIHIVENWFEEFRQRQQQ